MSTASASQFIAHKKITKDNIKRLYNYQKNVPYIGVVAIKNPQIRNFVCAGISALGIGAVILGETEMSPLKNIETVETLHDNELSGFDFAVFDGEHEAVDVVKYMKNGIVPIMPENNVFTGILKSFDPMKFEGNGFFYASSDPFLIFARVVAYLENIRFPEDRRVLLKNVTETF